MKQNIIIKIIFSFLLFASAFADASTAPKCSAVLIFQKSDVEAKVTAIVKTILTHQMSSAQGLQGNTTAFIEATRQINEIVANFPEMLGFYHAEMARLSKKDSAIKTKVKKVAEDQKVLDQKVQIEDSVAVIQIEKKPNFIFKKKDGTYFVIGNSTEFIDFFKKQKDIRQVLTTRHSFAIAILKNDGSVVTWGNEIWGGNSSHLKLTDVKSIFSTGKAFAALKNDGTVVTWGDIYNGGHSANLNLTKVKMIYSTGSAFIAIKKNGSVVAWGRNENGANISKLALKNINSIYSTGYAFAAVKNDGSVVAWGDKDYGADISGLDLVNVESISSTEYAFAALKKDGSVITWGVEDWGGDSAHLNLTHVKSIYSNESAIAALKKDGSVVTWGQHESGGDSSVVQNQLYDIVHIIEVKSGSFLALRKDGKYVLWGQPIGEYLNQVLDFDLM